MKEGKIGTVADTGQEQKTTMQSIGCGGTGGDLTAVDTKAGKIVRIRPINYLDTYTEEELAPSMWKIQVGDEVFTPGYKSAPNYFALAYKNRVYSKNRVRYPLKRADWEPGGDPATMNSANRGKSKFVRISWDEALDIMESEIKRIIEKYGPYSVLTIGEDGHRESKNLHAGGGMHSTLMSKLGGYTREVRTPDSVEGWYWGAKHFWGSGCNKGLGLPAPPQTGYNPWHVLRDISENSELIAFAAGDWELTQNYASQMWSRLLKFWEKVGKEFVIIDPFCNYTAVCHDSMKWIPILPNTDSALDFAVMYVWITEGLYNKDYVDTHSVGFDKVRAYVLGEDEEGIAKTPAWASERCGVPEWTIKAYARNRAKKITASVHFSSGAVKGPYSHEPGRTHAYLLGMQGFGGPGVQQAFMNASLIGKETIGRSTSAPFSSLNQCRMFYPSEQKIPRTLIAEALKNGSAQWWGSPAIVYVETSEQFQMNSYPTTKETYAAALGTVSPELARSQGKSLEDLQAALDTKLENMPKFSKIHMLWSEKPCNMNCWDGGFNYQDVIRTDEVEFFVTNHQWLENDSLFADLVLPVTTCIEDNDSMGGSMVVSIRHDTLTPPGCDRVGESKSDFEIACEIGERFGVRDQIDMDMTQDEWIRYGFEQSRLGEEISWDEYNERGFYLPKQDPDQDQLLPGLRGFYEDPENWPLDTPSGKLEFWSEALAENFPDDKERQPMATWVVGGSEKDGWSHDETLWGERCHDYPLLLVANPARFRVHVQGDDIKWFREIDTVKVKGKDGYSYEPIWMNPADAAARGIEAGDIVKTYNDRGTILTAACISERIIPGAAMIHKGSRVDPIAPHLDRGGAANLICPNNQVSKHCKGFAVSGYLVEAAKVEDAEMNQWKQDYPEAFARDYDPAIGINYSSWVVE
ncbi:MAG: molybdopterin-dependent oxidoreductase [Gordonibacter sp.]|uniref:molybdopterin-dependent oxidoreductase n=2 Tax=Gordonibacter sp. TaxID=1968902 RepID=UPI002FC7EB7C